MFKHNTELIGVDIEAISWAIFAQDNVSFLIRERWNVAERKTANISVMKGACRKKMFSYIHYDFVWKPEEQINLEKKQYPHVVCNFCEINVNISFMQF